MCLGSATRLPVDGASSIYGLRGGKTRGRGQDASLNASLNGASSVDGFSVSKTPDRRVIVSLYGASSVWNSSSIKPAGR